MPDEYQVLGVCSYATDINRNGKWSEYGDTGSYVFVGPHISWITSLAPDVQVSSSVLNHQLASPEPEPSGIISSADPSELPPVITDTDSDLVDDAVDNCRFASNINQQDRGGVATGVPDGIGDECQCGDVNDDGIVDNTDAVLIKRYLLGLPPGINISKCNVNSGNSCDNTDAILIQRAVLGMPPGLTQTCFAASGAP